MPKSYSLFPYRLFGAPYSLFKFLHICPYIAGAKNVTDAYLIIMLVYRCLLTKLLHGKAAVLQQITFEKQRNLFIQGYNHMYIS